MWVTAMSKQIMSADKIRIVRFCTMFVWDVYCLDRSSLLIPSP
jgi:hypothetical protein